MTNQEAADLLDNLIGMVEDNQDSDYDEALKLGIKALSDVREDIHGEWILDYRECGVEFYHCSKCNLGRAVIDGSFYKSLDEFKKCPICGIDMKGEDK